MIRIFSMIVILATAASCAVSPTGRRTIHLVDDSQLAAAGTASYSQLKQEQSVSNDRRANAYVQCIADAIIREVDPSQPWEVTVFDSEDANAFAVPGAKIGVFTGMFNVADNQHQLAAVMGHEVAHVIAKHSNERASAAQLSGIGMPLAQIALGAAGVESQQAVMQVLGLGVGLGTMKFSRVHESESDYLGLDYMARAGFDPRESVNLWRNMAAAGGGQPPEFMSTHPSHETRIRDLQANMPRAMETYNAARAAGKRPNCGQV